VKRIIGIAALAALLVPIPIQAQEFPAPAATLSLDEKLLNTLKRKAVVVIDAAVAGRRCDGLVMNVGQIVNGKSQVRRLRASSKLFGKTRFGGITVAPEGEYVLESLTCDPYGQTRTNFNGPHAKFHVRAGEFVNLGTLKIQYESDGFRTGKTHRSIENLGPDAMAYVKEQFPQTIAKMIKRPMTLVGPADARIQFRLCGLLACL